MESLYAKLNAPNFWKWMYIVRHLEYYQKEALSLYDFAYRSLSKLCSIHDLPLKEIILLDSRLPDNILFSQAYPKYPIKYDVEITSGLNKFREYLHKLQKDFGEVKFYEGNTIYSDILIRMLSQFSNYYGYFYEDVKDSFCAEDLMEFFMQYDELPIYPLSFPNNEESGFRIFEFITTKGCNLKSLPFAEVPKIECRKIDVTEYDQKSLLTLRDMQIMYKEFGSSILESHGYTPINDTNKVSKILALHKVATSDRFSPSSNISRIIGLIIVEYMYKNKLQFTDENIDRFRSYCTTCQLDEYDISKFYKGAKRLFDLDLPYLQRCARQTEKCIKENKVLSMKSGG